MISANSFAKSKKFRNNICDWLTDIPNDRPLIVQLNGHNPETLVQAGQLLSGSVDAVDLNLGKLLTLILILM